MAWTRESGTRKLLLLFAVLLVIWFIIGKMQDRMLLSKVWVPLRPDEKGLTIVGTLDSREAYDRNLFRIVQANKTARAELTDYGWRSIFTGTDGPLFSDQAGNAIQLAISVDGATGYAMLEPYLRVAVARALGQPHPESAVTDETPIIVSAQGSQAVGKQQTLGALIKKYEERGGGGSGQERETPSEGGGGEHEIDHGLPIPADTLMRSCPVVLTGAQFSGASLEEHPESILQGKTYTAHLYLKPEGRSRFYQWSHDHANENLCFILGNQVVAAGRIRQTLDVNEWEVGPLRDGDSAQTLVKFIQVSSHQNP